MPTVLEEEMFAQTKQKQQEYKDFVAHQKEELSLRRKEVKKHNDKVKKSYASKINKLKSQLRKLEKEMNSKMLEMPKLEKDAWAKHCLSKEWDENGEYDREGL